MIDAEFINHILIFVLGVIAGWLQFGNWGKKS